MQKIKSIGVMIDCSRDGVYTLETLKDYFNIISKMGYSTVQLYTEDVYEIDGEPYFGYLRGRYTKQELKELDAYAKTLGLELIPCIQTLAHLGGITRWQEYKPYTDIDNILLAGDERTYALIDKMFASCAECFSSRRINIGMDEAHMVGLGKYLDKNG
ncbi:MAG: family 20 glycosylhydrolase, partial [Clostridia bacterium]|nr:family 20 glycosylhydrolase [Clostridia bacterium]